MWGACQRRDASIADLIAAHVELSKPRKMWGASQRRDTSVADLSEAQIERGEPLKLWGSGQRSGAVSSKRNIGQRERSGQIKRMVSDDLEVVDDEPASGSGALTPIISKHILKIRSDDLLKALRWPIVNQRDDRVPTLRCVEALRSVTERVEACLEISGGCHEYLIWLSCVRMTLVSRSKHNAARIVTAALAQGKVAASGRVTTRSSAAGQPRRELPCSMSYL
jgi:hypothetical protein